MGRPHTEFIQTQVLPWIALGLRPGAEQRRLSQDEASGAASLMVRYPAGWRLKDQTLSRDEELFVLDGTLHINDVAYAKGDYAYLPAGLTRHSMHSDSGAVVLTFFEDEGVHGGLITKVESDKMAWGDPGDPVVAATANGAGLKVLREDSVTKERTWLLRFGADDVSRTTHGRVERHPVVEEFFLLDGEISMPCGVMKPGAYFWRPPMIAHGPVGTREGLLAFFRCKGGPLTTLWSDEALPITWQADYNPTLPADVASLARSSYDTSMRY